MHKPPAARSLILLLSAVALGLALVSCAEWYNVSSCASSYEQCG